MVKIGKFQLRKARKCSQFPTFLISPFRQFPNSKFSRFFQYHSPRFSRFPDSSNPWFFNSPISRFPDFFHFPNFPIFHLSNYPIIQLPISSFPQLHDFSHLLIYQFTNSRTFRFLTPHMYNIWAQMSIWRQFLRNPTCTRKVVPSHRFSTRHKNNPKWYSPTRPHLGPVTKKHTRYGINLAAFIRYESFPDLDYSQSNFQQLQKRSPVKTTCVSIAVLALLLRAYGPT